MIPNLLKTFQHFTSHSKKVLKVGKNSENPPLDKLIRNSPNKALKHV